MSFLKEAVEQAKHVEWLEGEVKRLGDLRTKFESEATKFESENKKLKIALKRAEKGSLLNANDEQMLINKGVELRFERKAVEGAKITAWRNGLPLRHGRKQVRADGYEGQSLLPQVLKQIRARYRS